MTYKINLEYKSARLDITVWEDDTYGSVSDVYATYRRKGHATGLMKRLIKIADQMKLDLILLVEPYSRVKGLDKDQLTAFYRKFGFKTTQDDVMERKAR